MTTGITYAVASGSNLVAANLTGAVIEDTYYDTLADAVKAAANGAVITILSDGEYELHEIEMLPTPEKAPDARGFIFTRNGQRVIACWHTSGSASLAIALDSPKTMPLAGLRYIETSLSADDAKAAWAAASPLR